MLFHNTTLEGDDLIYVLDSTQAVGDDKCGPAFHKALQCLLHKMLALTVQAACGFIQYKDRRVF